MNGRAEHIVVLMSTPALRPNTNPYAAMLVASLHQTHGVQPEFFSWKRALLGRYDVLHLHWPEAQLRGAKAYKTLGRQVLFMVILLRARLLKVPIVRTVHNLELPSGISRREAFVLRAVERSTTLRIRLNGSTPIPDGCPFETILHGHYRDWFARYRKHDTIAGRTTFFGLIRRYKGIPGLLSAFRETGPEASGLTLHISGIPSSDDLVAALNTAAAADPRISILLRALTDEELVREVGEAELVILPYAEMHNSGATLTALSLDRPVLVPDNPVNRALDQEVGTGWVHMYVPPLTGGDITSALQALHAPGRAVRPDLSARDWATSAAEHKAAYRRAVALLHNGSE
jgi:glycosyltransferase involved in cell wall biosynthesis